MYNKELIKSYMRNAKVYYTWYRFDSLSNYITFDEWVEQYVEKLTINGLNDFIKRNKLNGKVA